MLTLSGKVQQRQSLKSSYTGFFITRDFAKAMCRQAVVTMTNRILGS